mmetsp:Transcript_4168/g.9092  ORF Transcript_4168/g.9092 Transcript_4168/m.9092 type:complete len:175 (-) Transcript_4168:1125-1649(-)|eukprot:CAMPEP_0202903938 /NCGR_PEP_ID=MMETSP1392-20130828/27251_1 /ASSEMBLY_ACC=CAM_ASM_000868 /TAXON_ID=225041 /ORGANISM="Chlamydomonas chlamydogama, Strain SAG 11-48b" /LENGTH=174 /DNA_ID=CAMNT_0049591333 /DNA_START=105 /DNA_END=629 /DNA_ORIENTATION=+
MNTSNQDQGIESQPQPTLCKAGCGFFANVGTLGLCSKCYREAEQEKQKLEVAKAAVNAAAVPRPSGVESPFPVLSAPAVPSPSEAPSFSVPVVEPCSTSSDAPAPPPTNPPRCNVSSCKKKLGLTGFKCKCGHVFCGQHRYAESHSCTFDYKTAERAKLAENNPVVQASKVQKI